MTAHEDLVAWADYCAKLARDTPGPQFTEPLLTEIRLGWDRVIAAFQREKAAERMAVAWPKSWRQVRDLMQREGQTNGGS